MLVSLIDVSRFTVQQCLFMIIMYSLTLSDKRKGGLQIILGAKTLSCLTAHELLSESVKGTKRKRRNILTQQTLNETSISFLCPM